MPLISQKSALTVAAVLEIALHQEHGPLSARALAQRLRLGSRYLEPMLHGFVRAGILRATRGAIGGYMLGRECHRISVYDILRASRSSEDSSDPPNIHTSALVIAIVGPALARAEQTFATALQRISVDDLVRRAERKAVATSNPAESETAKS
jgi:Rrf2 family protein